MKLIGLNYWLTHAPRVHQPKSLGRKMLLPRFRLRETCATLWMSRKTLWITRNIL